MNEKDKQDIHTALVGLIIVVRTLAILTVIGVLAYEFIWKGLLAALNLLGIIKTNMPDI